MVVQRMFIAGRVLVVLMIARSLLHIWIELLLCTVQTSKPDLCQEGVGEGVQVRLNRWLCIELSSLDVNIVAFGRNDRSDVPAGLI